MSLSSEKKLYIGGLSKDVKEGALSEYFGQFGSIRELKLITDKITSKHKDDVISECSKGFGFVSYEDPAVTDMVEHMEHCLEGRKVDCKMAYSKEMKLSQMNKGSQMQMQGSALNHQGKSGIGDVGYRKMFVGGLHHLVNEAELGRYFSQYGEIEELIIMRDKITDKSRGFGFIVFKNAEIIEILLNYSIHYLRNKKIECKQAKPKESFHHPLSSSSLLIDSLSLTQPFYPLNFNHSIAHTALSPFPKDPQSEQSSFSYPKPLEHYSNQYMLGDCFCINKYLYYKLFNKDGERVSVIASSNSKDIDDSSKSKLPFVLRKSIDCELSTSSENEGKKTDSVLNFSARTKDEV